MARQALIVDASVGVKWFSGIGETHIPQARALLKAYINRDIDLLIPDLFFHEIANALVYKREMPLDYINESIALLFNLKLPVFPLTNKTLNAAIHIAREAGISEYDAYYMITAIENNCPLITADPKHQSSIAGCKVIPLAEWK